MKLSYKDQLDITNVFLRIIADHKNVRVEEHEFSVEFEHPDGDFIECKTMSDGSITSITRVVTPDNTMYFTEDLYLHPNNLLIDQVIHVLDYDY